jgi:hypothetical protein
MYKQVVRPDPGPSLLRLRSFSPERPVPGLILNGIIQPGLESDVVC